MQVKNGGAMNEDDELPRFIATSSELQKESEGIPIKIDIDEWDLESITDVPEDESQPLPEKKRS
jgi:hypothetical protein